LTYTIKKGLDLPLKGRPEERIDVANPVGSVAVLGEDYIGLKPTMLVQVGDNVQVGTPLFEDKKNPGVIITSPASGKVAQINRGAKRALQSVVVDVEGEDAVQYSAIDPTEIDNTDSELIRKQLIDAGAWTSFRTRPYGKVPAIDSDANSIFVNLMDTNPLAVNPMVIVGENADAFSNGVRVLSRFGVPVHLCHEDGVEIPSVSNENVSTHSFSGPHPAGLSSTHIHLVDPVDSNKTVWTIGYQDVIAIGNLITTGRIDTRRYAALAGPSVNSPRVFETRVGANLEELVASRLIGDDHRVISGSVLNGHHAVSELGYLGRYDNQVTVLPEAGEREFMGWIAPGAKKFSALNVFLSSLIKPQGFNFNTSQNGSPRALVPIGVFEKVMPLDILPTPLVRALLVKDTDTAQTLGCLELVEEDMALCSFVDPGKHDFGPVLRSTLTQIEREG
jgi:Na+-transporting NADH:ubiquinone oxidoreductase subunit A